MSQDYKVLALFTFWVFFLRGLNLEYIRHHFLEW